MLLKETSSVHSYAVQCIFICAPQHKTQHNMHEQAGSIESPHLLAFSRDMQADTKKKEASSSCKPELQLLQV